MQFINIGILFLFASLLIGQPKYSANEIVEKVQQKYSQMHDASANFTQKISLRFGKKEQVQSGSVKIKSGNKYRIELPQQVLVTDGKTIWVYSPENKQVLVDNVKQNNGGISPDKFLTGFPEDFFPTKVEEVNDELIVSLSPSEKSSKMSFITTLTMWIQPEEWIIKKIKYTDRNKSQSEITLTNILFNQKINDSVFNFEPTAETKTVDMRKLK